MAEKTLDVKRLESLLNQLTGEPVPLADPLLRIQARSEDQGLGYSQLNELLLLCGLDRISPTFFAYLLNGSATYEAGMAFDSLDRLEEGIIRFRKTALLLYGNVKFAFKSFSQDVDVLHSELERLSPVDVAHFVKRHEPIIPIAEIKPEEAYLTGYLVQKELEARLATGIDEEARELETRRLEIVERAKYNQTAYLASDHLDVYVATSMRAAHEFIAISRTVRKIFDDAAVKCLGLRYFDPTQAYCAGRIDKGLSEALMLKRASCTIYLAQESDTLGKDSELASTLAQGKPVIAYIPNVDDDYFDEHLNALRDAEPNKKDRDHLLDQLKLFNCGLAWTDSKVKRWCQPNADVDLEELREDVKNAITTHYDRRARTLKEDHPLGIQVNLDTGVANGVLVVRNTADCARLVRGIVTKTLEFDLDETPDCTMLRERISGSIFRVMTSDMILTNTFWNFYLNPAG